MNRKLPRLILILLIVAIVAMLFACSPSGEDSPVTPPTTNGGVTNGGDQGASATVNKSQIFAEIKEGLVNAGSRIEETETGTRYVDSSYTLIANSVNVGIEYQANYDLSRDQDSEIMVRVFDYNKEENTAFVYYSDNDLYLQFGDEYVKMEGFGGTSTFKLFFEAITALDMQQTLFSVNFAGKIESMSSFAETQNITKIILSNTEHNVTIKNINLDQLKSTVNDFIQDNIATIGTRLDAVTNKILGFELSDLGRVQVGLFTATEMMTVFEEGANGDLSASDFSITFAGNQANNIDTYYFDVNYATNYKEGAIRLTKNDDPDTNNYTAMNASAVHFVGELFIPYFDQSFDTEIKGNFSTDDNSLNEIFVDVVNRTDNQGEDFSINERVLGLMYKNGKVYLDATGLLENYLGDFIDYEKLGFPKIEISGFNIAEELQALLEKALGIVSLEIDLNKIFGTNEDGNPSLEENEKFNVLINKVRSENGVFYITIDNEFVSEVIGESGDTIISSLAESLGLEEGLIRDIIDLGYFDNLNLEIAWDTNSDAIILKARAGEEELFVLTLASEEVPESGLIIEFPDRTTTGYFDTFSEFDNPETINLHVEGTLRTQGQENNSITNAMGMFIGDISGKNGDFSMTISDVLYLSMDLWQTGDQFFVNANVTKNSTPLVAICSDLNDPETLLINNYDLGVKYKMPRAEILRLIGELTQNKAVWEFDSIVNALETIVEDASIEVRDDDVLVKISPYGTGDNRHDPLFEIFGVENFIAELAISVGFEVPASLEDPTEYVTPVINIVDEVRWTSIYEATWVDTATVIFGEVQKTFRLTFEGESATLVTGKYEYYPEAKLFGQTVTYRLFFTDTVNGTSVVQSLYDNHMTIDPSEENPIPETIQVVYTNGQRGYLPYVIEGFPYNNANISQLMGGLRAQDYDLVIGKGSIAEMRFTLRLDVLGRNIKVNAGDYYNNIPIVAKVVIDPYEYSINKHKAEAEGRSYYPFKYREEGKDGLASDVLRLAFYAYPDSDEVRYVDLERFDWNFDESKITYAGGEFTQVQKYNTLDIALVVVVQAKEVAYVQINDENNGYYTIDSLITSTYNIPSITNNENEVRIYFETGRYRIIGVEPHDFVNTDPLCDGYYDSALAWSITYADNVTIDRSIHPLQNGKTNKTVCTFGDDVVGKQEVTLTVVCPTRVIGTRTDTTLAITSLQYDLEGGIIEDLITYEAVKVSLACFSSDGDIERDYFEFDPYSDAESNVNLPSVVYVKVTYEGKEQMIGYPITWLDEGENVIDSSGRILNALSDETYFRVKGIIGDGELTQTLEMVIHNKSGSYQNVIMLDENQTRMDITVRRYNESNSEITDAIEDQVEVYRRYFMEGLNPYDKVALPSYVTLQFPFESGIEDKTYPASWYLENGTSADTLIAPPEGGTIKVFTDIQGGEGDGLLNQTIELSLVFVQKQVLEYRIYGVSDSADEGYLIQQENGQGVTIHYVEVDTYDVESQELYDKLSAGLNKVGIGFVDGTRSNGVEISWVNLDQFLSVLQSPLGSSTYYNNGAYEDDIVFLRGIIRQGTIQEKEIKMGFKVFPRVLGEINFTNYDENLSVRDENGVAQVQLVTETKRANAVADEEGNVTVTMTGNNIINITFNKYFALRGERLSSTGVMEQGLTTPSQYIEYLFSNVSLSFADSVRNNALKYQLRSDFDELVYGNATTTDTDVTINDTHVIIRLTIDKLSEGSCVQSFAVTLTYLKDNSVLSEDDAQNEAVEVFDENGYPLYETNEGYVLDDEYAINFVNSGAVVYNDLVWYADEAVSSLITNETIAQGAIVKNIKYDFFNFTSTRTIKLYTYLPNGQKFRRHLNFYSKNVNLVNYKTDNVGLYQVVNGTLEINNVYDYLPLDDLIANVPTVIVPNQTAMFISTNEIRFTLENGWLPTPNFAQDDDPTKFSTEKLSAQITSEGLNSTLLATGTIVGYNGEKQTINLYVKVRILSNGQISHKDYDVVGNTLVYDQYAEDGNGVFNLPKDIKVTFGDVFYEFDESDNVVYEIRSKLDDTLFTQIEAITYNNLGHTLSADYGYGANDDIYLRVTLPDGNNTLRLIVRFPSRKLQDVAYLSKVSEGQNMQLSGIYYVDPYDKATFDLPTTALFKYEGTAKYIEQKVNWTLASEGAPFLQNADGSFTYNGKDYQGASYLFHSSLQSFDENDDEQVFILQVYVLNRSIVNRPSEFKAEYYVDNPFSTRVMDLPYILTEEAFYDLSQVRTITTGESKALTDLYSALQGEKKTVTYLSEIYDGISVYNSEYVARLVPALPSVVWKKEISGERTKLVDDDIKVTGDFRFNLYGYLSYGEGEDMTEGEIMEMEIYADKWEFQAINGLVDYVVEFNDYTMVSIQSSFEVAFKVGSEERTLTFYPEHYADDEEKERSVIVWNKENWADGNELGSVTFTNLFKSDESNKITTYKNYKFDAQMVGIDEISFGFGEGYATSGNVELVIDPLNPVIPVKALARGKLQTDAQTEIDLGEVNIEWVVTDENNSNSIYYMDIAGGTRRIECKVTSSGQNDNEFPFIINVTYLNRTPNTIGTEETGYTNVGKDGDYYPLLRTTENAEGGLVKNYTFVIDPTPTDTRLFNVDGNTNVSYIPFEETEYVKSNYTLPSSLRLTFANDYEIGSIGAEGLNKLGAELHLKDIEWIISRDISLIGTDVLGENITAQIRKFRVEYVANGQTYLSELYDFVDDDDRLEGYLDLILTTTNRQVEYTYIYENGANEVLSSVPEGSLINYQKAGDRFYVDPYNIYFPEDLYVIFSGTTIPYHATDVVWDYDKEYLGLTEVITGKTNPAFMFIMASLQVYGTTLEIQFPIRARDIPTSVITSSGEYTTEPLLGGTLYVLQGRPVAEQLPTNLYYRFDYSDGTSEIASAPLTFPAVSISTINTQEAGKVYSNIKAKLGTVDDDNIVFTVIVIDPKLYVLKDTVTNSLIGEESSKQATYANGGYVYDFVAVGVNAVGAYVAGPETSILPDKVIISDEGDYMDIIDIEYDVERMVAVVNCRYTFLSFSDSSKLSGDKYGSGENSDKMFLSFEVPIKTYSYNWIESTEAVFEKNIYEFELGTIITASDMPATTSGITPIWELNDINPNKAGEYVATCHFKNAYGKIITGEITIIINRKNITSNDIEWVKDADGVDFRERIYTGEQLNVADYLEFATFLREDGTYGMLEGYTVMFSIDGRKNWQYEQPVSVKEDGAEDYFVRIIVNASDDYNYSGYVDYKMVISKCVILEEEIYFHKGDHQRIEESDFQFINKDGASTSVSVKQITFEYDGNEKIPNVGGVPKGATYLLSFAHFDPESTNQAYNETIRPVNAGTYIMKMEFTADQRNYTISADAVFTIVINITKKNVTYSLPQTMPYTGDYFDVKVLGLPEVLGDIQVVYSYYNVTTNVSLPAGSRLRDAGTYEVTVKIYGGVNYPSANTEEEGSLNVAGLINTRFTVEKRKVILNVGTVSSEYLAPLKPLNSSVNIVSYDNPEETGLVGKDTMQIFGNLEVAWTEGVLTYKHMVGSYTLALVNKGLEHKNYEFVTINDGVYNVIAEQANTRVIENKADLDEALGLLTDGATVRWYLKAGNYGTITINKNASVSIIGSYDITAETEIIAVRFTQIIVEKGAVLLDIVAFGDIANASAVVVGKDASSLTISRCEFTRTGTTMLANSSAISTAYGYSDTVYVSESYFSGFATALYLQGGNLEMATSTLYQNMNGVYVQSGNIVLDTNEFIANRGVAVNIAYALATVSIFDNLFDSNDTAIKTVVALRNDIRVQNTFSQNTVTFDGWSD